MSGAAGRARLPGRCADPMEVIRDRRGRDILLVLLGSAILAFGLYHVHSYADITEGGILGLTLLLEHWLHISPAVSGLVLHLLCYVVGWRVLGNGFVLHSLLSVVAFSVFYAVFEQFPPLWPGLAVRPLLAAALGALFVGTGVGLAVRAGAASGGDDAVAMAVSHKTGLPIEWFYLVTDVAVLLLSASYLPGKKLLYSLMTVVLSGQLIGLIQRWTMKSKK